MLSMENFLVEQRVHQIITILTIEKLNIRSFEEKYSSVNNFHRKGKKSIWSLNEREQKSRLL